VYFEGDEVVVEITPTYSGCPAMQAITTEIGKVLTEAGFPAYKVKTVLSPAWTTDWMSEATRQKLVDYGIAAPGPVQDYLERLRTGKSKPARCPFCGSDQTRLTSAFGSTACKALHYCDACQQPFEEFKCH
jgi:ring-1,2-phenylacetyl-CoA epoxidase subunit PaaD